MHIYRRLWYYIRELLFPERCAGCTQPGTSWCTDCRLPLRYTLPRTKKDITLATFPYRHPTIRSVVLKLKRRHNKELVSLCGHALAEMIAYLREKRPDIPKTITLVPIPLHRGRLVSRGFNQALVLARMSARYLSHTHVDARLLTKKRRTQKQTTLQNRIRRKQNVEDAFKVHSQCTKNTHYIIIDDVTTTGATLTQARRALKRAGARYVSAVALAG